MATRASCRDTELPQMTFEGASLLVDGQEVIAYRPLTDSDFTAVYTTTDPTP